MIGLFSQGIANIAHLELLLGEKTTLLRKVGAARHCRCIAGWGLKPTASKARSVAGRFGLPYLALEDGLLRSVGLGSQEPPLSVVVDELGVYYDATSPSQLEQLIAQPLTPDETARSHALIAAWRAARVSKYNHLREFSGELPRRYVLVADQTFGDASIQYGLADSTSYMQMLEAACVENPGCTVLVKMHPDVFSGKKKGHFDLRTLAGMKQVQVLAEDVHPVRLIEQAESLYVVTSQMGFEGLLWGKLVHTFGMPFYAGWGLTNDLLPAPERRATVTLEQLVHAALIRYPRYLDPETCQRCEPERLVEWMGLQRRMRERFPAKLYAPGFSWWKRPIVRSYFQASQVMFAASSKGLQEDAGLVVWGNRPLTDAESGQQVFRLEDGFLRSVGLGVDLVRPLSWVQDGQGIYYDATHPSDLESILQHTQFFEALCDRAARLRKRIVTENLTKYNVGTGSWKRPGEAQRVILVPGQVESDASLAYGAPGIRTNMGLLQAVRQYNPEAWVVYKPHPDVLAGLRARGQDEDQALQWCNEQVTDIIMGDLLQQVDEVHTLTSLAGFEALMRGKQVVCYGQPFYSGWGLTSDMIPVARRTRQLTLDELVAGALILYPTYISRTTGRYTTPEQALDELLAWRDRQLDGVSLWTRLKRLVLRQTARYSQR